MCSSWRHPIHAGRQIEGRHTPAPFKPFIFVYLLGLESPFLVTTACASRQPNQARRALRQSMNLSQHDFAVLIRKAGDEIGEPNSCNKDLVQRWESGAYSTCRPRYRHALEQATGTPYRRLGFHDAWSEPAPGNQPSIVEGPVAHTDPGEHFRFAMATPIQVTGQSVAIAQSTVARLFDLDQHTPARLLLPTVARHLDEIAALLCGTHDASLRQRLISSGGQAAALAGRLALDRGESAQAHRYWDNAMAAARDGADNPLLACVHLYLAHAAQQHDDHTTAWQFAHRATEHAPDQPRVRAWIAVQAAQAAARCGDSAAALAELKIAQDWDLEIGPPPGTQRHHPALGTLHRPRLPVGQGCPRAHPHR